MKRTATARFLAFLAIAAAFALVARAFAADRVALVIGNAAYQTQKVLTNPVNDAGDISAMLRKIGFEVIEATDLDKRGIELKTREFRTKLQSASVALLFYAGHGMQVEGRNYILPVDARIDSADDVKLEAVELDTIMQQMRGKDRINIVILDACRDNPYARAVSRPAGPDDRAAKSAFGGLAEVKSSVGSVIIFATDPGNVASDGGGRNSPFTEALLRNVPEPGVDLGRMMMKVRYDVIRATESKQVPWESSSLITPVYLAGEAGGQPIQQAALSGAGGAARSLSQTREGAPQSTPGSPPPSPVDDFGGLCDRLATHNQDPLRKRDMPFARNVDFERAIPACEKAVAASPGILRYANQLGRSYIAARRYEDAVRTYREAAERGSAFATAEMGFLHFRGWGGVPRDYPAARLWIEKAARLGVPIAMSNMGYMLARGLGGTRDQTQARQWYTRALALNDPMSMVEYASALQNGWFGETNLEKAREILEKAVAMNDPFAMAYLAYYRYSGIAGPKDFEEARRLYERAAAEGDAGAMAAIGFMFRDGMGGFPKDFKLAREWFARAAKLNNSSGHYGLALMYGRGEGVEKDLVEARKQFETAAQHDDTNVIRNYVDWLLEGAFGNVEREEARKWLQHAAGLDDEISRERLAGFDRPETSGEACDRLGAIESDPLRPPRIKASMSSTPDKTIPACEAAIRDSPDTIRYQNQLGRALIDAGRYGEAKAVFEKAAERKSAFAAVWVGNIYDRGLGVPKSAAHGVDWYLTAAELGSLDGMYNLAYAHLKGDGIPANHEKARHWFGEAVKLGSASAMRELGFIYYNGTGVRKDYTAARQWLEKAAAKEDASAMRVLGDIYNSGLGIEKNFRLARQWYAQAAAANNTDAMQSLANLYISGIGGAKEPTKARGLLEQAAGADVSRAMVTLAQAHLAGAFGDTDETEARKWLEKAAGLNNETARRMLEGNSTGGGSVASHGEICDRSAASVNDPLRSVSVPVPAHIDGPAAITACAAALAAAPATLRYANQLGLAYISQSRNFDALRVFRGAAEKGSSFAMLWVGNMYERGLGVAQDPAQSIVWYQKAAENGLPVAAYNMGMYYLNRFLDDIDKNASAAAMRKWFETGAELAHPDAMWRLAIIYIHGQGVTADPVKAFEWLEKAADFGSDSAINDLAVRLIKGDGIEKNHVRARDLLEQAVSNGLAEANTNLAHLYLFGEVPEDKPRARKLLEASADKQNVGAIVYLAQALNAGTFGTQEPDEARRLLRLAADLGSTKGKELLEKMK